MSMLFDKKIFWNLVKREMSDDFVHGLPHVERVYKLFEILKAESDLPQEILKALEIAVICHDVGRKKANNRPHAEVSAKMIHSILGRVKIPKNTKELIEFAVAGHSCGLKAKWKNYREAVLGLLSYLDHLDALGSVGIARVFLFCKIPIYPAKFSSTKIISMLRRPEVIDSRNFSMKNKSILEHLVYNYCITWNLRKRVADLIPKKLRKIERERLDIMKSFILNMIKERKIPFQE
jgi:HD superfamily phosphodiesterase